jgi:O-antigen/teichoic acid export membrane protein
MADQFMSSITNFALAVIVARSQPVEEFGEFALLFWTYLLLLNVGRALGSQPLMVKASHVGGEAWRRAQGGSAGIALAAACLFGCGLTVMGIALGGQALAFAALGLGLPGLLVQDAYRLGLIADGRARLSFGSDLTWAMVMAVLLGGLSLSGGVATVPLIVLIWSAGALAGSIYAIWACGVLPEPGRARPWLRDNLRLIRGFAFGTLATPVAMTISQYLLAAVAGLVVVAALRAGQLLLAPITVTFQGIVSVLAPEASRWLREDPSGLVRRLVMAAIVLGGLAVGYGLVLAFLPEWLGQSLLGDSWSYARPLLPLLVVAATFDFVSVSAEVGLLVRGEATSIAKVALLTATAMVVLATAGGAWTGATGAAAGIAAAYLFALVAFWFVFLRASRSVEATVPTPTRRSEHLQADAGPEGPPSQ